jgi:hypothetical protein
MVCSLRGTAKNTRFGAERMDAVSLFFLLLPSKERTKENSPLHENLLKICKRRVFKYKKSALGRCCAIFASLRPCGEKKPDV